MWVNQRRGGGGPPGERIAKCQKCLQTGHYTYECKEKERAYVSRPSRTQQLKNPKLAQKYADFTGDEPPDPKREYQERMDAILRQDDTKGSKERKEKRKRRRGSSSSSSSSRQDKPDRRPTATTAQ